MTNEHLELADRLRRALIQRAAAAFEDASVRGLCCEGAWEAAISALRDIDLAGLMEQPPSRTPGRTG